MFSQIAAISSTSWSISTTIADVAVGRRAIVARNSAVSRFERPAAGSSIMITFGVADDGTSELDEATLERVEHVRRPFRVLRRDQ